VTFVHCSVDIVLGVAKVGTPIHNRGGNARLATQGINRHDATMPFEDLEQFGNRRIDNQG
jgi:hypothetical protein